MDHELQMKKAVLSKRLDGLQSNDTPRGKISSVLDQQYSIFSKVDFTELDRTSLNELQHDFEEVISLQIALRNTIPEIDLSLQSTFYSVVSGSGNIQFQDEFPDEIKQHVVCTIARLMMCPSGGELIQEIMNGDFPVQFVLGTADCGMIASPLDEVAALVKNVRYDDSETDRSSDSDMTSTGSESSVGIKNTEDVLNSVRGLLFRNNKAFQSLPDRIRQNTETYEHWGDVDKSISYPLKRHTGSESIITISNIVVDGSITVGGEDEKGALKAILCPSFIVLGHELIHAYHNQLGLNLRDTQRDVFDTSLPNSFSTLEEFETITGRYFSFSENQLRIDSGFNEKFNIRTGHTKNIM